MDFSSLVLMEKDRETNFLTKEIGSYEVGDGAKYITKMFYDGELVNVFFDTGRDVEEWEFSAVYDLFDEEVFAAKGYSIEDVDDEYNPTWLVKFKYEEEHLNMKKRLNDLCAIILDEIERVLEAIIGKEEDYK